MKFNLYLNILIILISLFTAYNVYNIYNKKSSHVEPDTEVDSRIIKDLELIKKMNVRHTVYSVEQRNAIWKDIVENFEDLYKVCVNKNKIQYKCGRGTKLVNNTCEINWGPDAVFVNNKQWANRRIEEKITMDLQKNIKYNNEVPRSFKASFDVFPIPN